MLILLSILALAAGDTYVWQQSSNWGNPQNWQQARLPCAAETVLLSASHMSKEISKTRNFQITLDVNQTLQRLYLAPGGRIRLQVGTHFKLSQTTSCKDDGLPSVTSASINHFTGVRLHAWNCAHNWKRQSDGKTSSNVPCGSDVVRFPLGKSVSWVSLQSDVKVGKLEWMGEEVRTFSDIPNSGTYFVKTTTSSNLTIDPQCLLSQPSLCRCYPSNCSIYPTSQPTTTTTIPLTTQSTTCLPDNSECRNPEEIQDSNTDSPIWHLVVGISAGIIAIILIVNVIVCFLLYRKRKSNVPIYQREEPGKTSRHANLQQTLANPAFEDGNTQITNPVYIEADDVLADTADSL